MIPALADGVLPEGVHSCTFDELTRAFGHSAGSDRRARLTEALRRYVEEARRSGIAVAVVVDGSYATSKERPSDIDLILVLREDLELNQDLRPREYNIQSRRRARRFYGFDVLTALDGSETYEKQVDFFSRVRSDDPGQQTSRTRKGLLRVEL